jgi:nitrite reductase/ring-hydroxylating ferredoxin subunit
MSRHLLVSLKELQDKKRFTAWLGRDEVLAVLTPEGVRVYSAMCPHQGGPLGEGVFAEDRVTCPWHGCTFELNQGGCTDMGTCRNVSGMRLKTLPHHVESENVYVELP